VGHRRIPANDATVAYEHLEDHGFVQRLLTSEVLADALPDLVAA